MSTPLSAQGDAAPGFIRWWFRPVPLARIAVYRVIVYLFIPIDVFLTTSWVRAHADVPTEWYQPLLVGRLLHLPTPTSTVVTVVLDVMKVAHGRDETTPFCYVADEGDPRAEKRVEHTLPSI